MKLKTKKKLLCCFLAAAVLYFPVTEAFSAQWRAGVSSAVATPDEPMWTGGYAGRREPAVETIIDIYIKALAIQDPTGERVVIVTGDFIGFPFEVTNHVAGVIGEKWGLPRSSIIFNASHTHSGPDIRGGWPVKTVFVEWIPDDYYAKIGTYRSWLQDKLVEIIDTALTNMSPVNITFSSIRPVPFAVSRRFPDGEGGVIYRSNPSNYYTGGPRDDTVPVLKVAELDGSVKAILFGYACHPITLGGDRYSGDYPGFAQIYVESEFQGAVALFMQGCSGELVPNARHQVEYAMGQGKALAEAVKRAVEGPQTKITGPIRTAYKDVALNFAPLTKEILEEQFANASGSVKTGAGFFLEKLARGEEVPRSVNAPLHAISFGPELLLVGFPGEAVVDYAVNSKKEFSSGAGFVWATAFNNYVLGTTSVGYLPTLDILRQGGYEAHERSRSPSIPAQFAEDVEDIVMGGMRELVNTVRR